MATKKQQYRVLVGIDYPGKKGEKRAEAGEVVDDIPASGLEGLLAAGAVEPVED